jgi:hypothetical protein
MIRLVLRALGAVFAGIITVIVLVGVGETLGHRFFPLPPEIDSQDQDCPVNADVARCISLLLKRLSVISSGFDLNSRVALSHFTLAEMHQGMAYAQRSLRFLPTDRILPQLRIQQRIKPFYRALPNSVRTQVLNTICICIAVSMVC